MQVYESYKARWLENQHLIRAYQRGEQYPECELKLDEREELISGRGVPFVNDGPELVVWWLNRAAMERKTGQLRRVRVSIAQARFWNRQRKAGQ